MLFREVLAARHPWLERIRLALATLLATGVLWSVLLGALASGCWRGGSPQPCPPGAVSTGGPGGGPVCEVKPRIVRRYPRCDKLDTLVRRLEPLDIGPCWKFFDDSPAYDACLRSLYEYRVNDLEWRWTTAVSICASENVP